MINTMAIIALIVSSIAILSFVVGSYAVLRLKYLSGELSEG